MRMLAKSAATHAARSATPLLRRACLLAAASAGTALAQEDTFVALYQEHCSVCHGANMEGTPQGTPLVGMELRHGDSVAAMAETIAQGVPLTAMPAWSETLTESEIQKIAIHIGERRADLAYTDFKVAAPFTVVEGVVDSEAHDFRIETVVTGLHPLPFSIAPLPDERILVTEKTQGLRVVSPDGELSEPIRGTPQAFDDGFQVPGILLVYGIGYLLDVAPHPRYEDNGWIYLHYTDRCTGCNETSRNMNLPVSMNALIRGRIENGSWVDQETIWKADIAHYTPMPDMGAGGRIAFDDAGHVFFSIGIKGLGEHVGIQDLTTPYGKIHRLNDDGSIPADNPFAAVEGALPSIWTYGHRSPQGLEVDARTGRLWGTEMGPRGGDEVNLLVAGRNYGWPLESNGINYDGTPVGAALDIEFDPEDIEQPIVDLTPSPAVSSFTIYDGDAFPGWRRNLLVGTLKATELYRMVVEDDRVVHTEVLLNDFGRIRDVETGHDGAVYLLIEHAAGGQIVRLVPAGA